ncbi:SGNH/GDSL hydrolase family protein [Enterobacter kobei]|uniref:SGNH/GDSL hydrolase family protein n=1 Tax=Enterobacter cloacae complex TaxID=354276 RepID=UPI0021D354E9|nr:SGNH/GDSL hydrolase family protein [Enterobacter asburiae]
MKDKRIFIPCLLALCVAATVITSCQSTGNPDRRVTSFETGTNGRMINYGEKQLTDLSEKLKRSNTETTHIIVIGDSHTAADFLSGQLRSLYQRHYGNGGPGFISPMRVPGNRYSHVNYSKARGWQLETSRKTKDPTFTLGGNIATPTSVNNSERITISDGETELQARALYRSTGDAMLQLGGETVTLSGTQGRWTLSRAVPVADAFAVSMKGNGTQLAGFWLTSRHSGGVIVSALGINGAQISMLDKWASDWPGTLSNLTPDLVILAFGTNEAFNISMSAEEYQQTLLRQIRKIRQAVPDAAILLVGPGSSIMNKSASGCSARQSPVLKTIIEVQKKVAASEHTLFWDWFAFMGGDCSIERWADKGKARPDLVHLTSDGYQETASALWQDLEKTMQ